MTPTRIADEINRIRVLWSDLNGISRGCTLPVSEYERSRDKGIGFAAGVAELTLEPNLLESPAYGPESGDIVAVPETSPKPIHWQNGIGLVFANLTHVDGTAFDLCSRSTLDRVLDAVKATGYIPQVGVELEFSLLRETDDGDYVPFNDRSSYDIDAIDRITEQIDTWTDAMAAADFDVTGIHQESQPGQYELTFKHGDPKAIADGIVFFRNMIKAVARQQGLKASMMPAPYTGTDANGMHVHLSLWDDALEKNQFAAETGSLQFPSGTRTASGGLSTVAHYVIGGLLEHADALTAVCAPTVNSYKRLQPGSWAPINVAWGPDNRSTVIRIPPNLGDATRLEVRLPDTSSNPYLALAALLAAGIDGIEAKREPPTPTTENAYRECHGHLPRTLWSALEHLDSNELLRCRLGDELIDSFLAIKRDEFDRYQRTVTEWERQEYLDAF